MANTYIANLVCEIFEEQQNSLVIESQNITKIFFLYKECPIDFMRIFGSCLVNIIKNHKKLNRRQQDTYEKLVSKTFSKIYNFSFNEKGMTSHNETTKHEESIITDPSKHKFFNKSWEHKKAFMYFIKLFTFGLGSQFTQIQMFCAKTLINIFKNFGEPNKDGLRNLLQNSEENQPNFLVSSDSEEYSADEDPLKNHQHLIKNGEISSNFKRRPEAKEKQRSNKLIDLLIEGSIQLMQSNKQLQSKMAGLKIGSYLQFLNNKSITLQNQQIQFMTLEDNKELRKSAVFNLEINAKTLPHFIKRIRDKDISIRKEVLLKLKRSKFDVFNLLTLKQKYTFIDDSIRIREKDLVSIFIEYIALDVVWGNCCYSKNESFESVSGELLLQKLKNFLKLLEIENIIKIPRFHEDMFLLVKELLLYDGSVIMKKIAMTLIHKYCKNQSIIINQTDCIDLFILNTIFELCYITYKRKKNVDKQSLDDEHDVLETKNLLVKNGANQTVIDQKNATERNINTITGFVDKILDENKFERGGLDENLNNENSTEEQERFGNCYEVYLLIEDNFPPMSEIIKHLPDFFELNYKTDTNISQDIEQKTQAEKYLFLNILSFLINCDDFGRSQLVNEIKSLFLRLEGHTIPLNERISYLYTSMDIYSDEEPENCNLRRPGMYMTNLNSRSGLKNYFNPVSTSSTRNEQYDDIDFTFSNYKPEGNNFDQQDDKSNMLTQVEYKNFNEAVTAYLLPFGGDRSKYRIALGEEDLYPELIKILRGVLPDRRGEFTCEVLQLFSELIDVNSDQLVPNDESLRLSELKGLKKEKNKALSELKKTLKSSNFDGENFQDEKKLIKKTAIRKFTDKFRNYYYKHLQFVEKQRKGLRILRNLQEYVSIGKFDDNLKPLSKFFNDYLFDEDSNYLNENDVEINILLYSTFSNYIMIEKKRCSVLSDEVFKGFLILESDHLDSYKSDLLEIQKEFETNHQLKQENLCCNTILSVEMSWEGQSKIVACRHFIDAFILHGLQKEDEPANEERIINDNMIVYSKTQNFEDDDEIQEDFNVIIDQLCKYLLTEDQLLKSVVVEGLTKLILGNCLSQSEIFFQLLYVIWHDKKMLASSKGVEIAQYLSSFMITYSSSDNMNLVSFENSLEFMFEVFWEMVIQNYELNSAFASSKVLEDDSILNYQRFAIKLISYEKNKSIKGLRHSKGNTNLDPTPLERFYCYMCWCVLTFNSKNRSNLSNKKLNNISFLGSFLISLLNNVCEYFDIINNCTKLPLIACLEYTSRVIKELDESTKDGSLDYLKAYCDAMENRIASLDIEEDKQKIGQAVKQAKSNKKKENKSQNLNETFHTGMDQEGNMTNEPNDSIFKHFEGLKFEENFGKKDIKISLNDEQDLINAINDIVMGFEESFNEIRKDAKINYRRLIEFKILTRPEYEFEAEETILGGLKVEEPNDDVQRRNNEIKNKAKKGVKKIKH